MNAAELAQEDLDEHSVIVFLKCPREKVVQLQGHFEIYEGIGIVRTLDLKRSLLCVVTTKSMLPDTLAVLDALRDEMQWSYTPPPSVEDKDLYLGYQRQREKQTSKTD